MARPIDIFLRALNKYEIVGDDCFKAICPVCKNGVLTVRLENGRLVLTCYRHCSYGAILNAVRVDRSDLRAKAKKPDLLRIAAVPRYIRSKLPGKSFKRQTIYNWIKHGKTSPLPPRKKIYLMAENMNGYLYTKKEWVDDFMESVFW